MNRADGCHKVLVTGGAGFIGSHLCEALVGLGHRVVAVDDLSLGRMENLKTLLGQASLDFHHQDVRDRKGFHQLFSTEGIDTVFHLAANSDISRSISEPRRDLDLNFDTTLSVLEAIQEFSVSTLVFASTSAVYGEADVALAESFGPLRPISFYGASKLCAEAYISAYAHLLDFKARVCRFPNVVGERSTHGVIRDFVIKLLRDPRSLEILGDGRQSKPYLYVSDLVQAILTVWRAPGAPVEVFNIGVEDTTSVRRIAEIVVEAMGLQNVEFRFTGGRGGWPGDVPHFTYVLDRIHACGWRPRFSSDEAVAVAARRIVKHDFGAEGI